jgi:tetratricopeptide (TPR) repeat protein
VFMCYAREDSDQVEELARLLQSAGISVWRDTADLWPGQDWRVHIRRAIADNALAFLACFSRAGLARRARFQNEELVLAAEQVRLRSADDSWLIPVRFDNCQVPELDLGAGRTLAGIQHSDLFGDQADSAAERLVAAVVRILGQDVSAGAVSGYSEVLSSGQAAAEPIWRGSSGPGPGLRWPGVRAASMPHVWNLPPRNPGFTGRDSYLQAIRDRLDAGGRAVVQALQGMGGVGKTQIVIEYAYRFASDYDLVWWIAAERSELIPDQVAALANAHSGLTPGGSTSSAARAVIAGLRSQDRWLLIFDNATCAEDVRSWLPGSSSGHVLITSRQYGWEELAAPVEVDVFARAESGALLQSRIGWLTDVDEIDQLAEALGDLPLGVVQAANYLRDTGVPVHGYLDLLGTHADQILAEGRPPTYPVSLAAATRLTVSRLAGQEPVAIELLTLCAFLAPEPVPASVLIDSQDPVSRAEREKHIQFRRMLAVLGRSALVRMGRDELQMHRLTQAVVRDNVADENRQHVLRRARCLLIAASPGEPRNPENWQRFGRLLPHVIATDLIKMEETPARMLVIDCIRYMRAKGDYNASANFASKAYQQWTADCGPDHPDTLAVATDLARAWWRLGDYMAARNLNDKTLKRRRLRLGLDHPETMRSAGYLATDLRLLGEVEAALDLDEDTLERRRRVLGANHPDTLNSAQNVAIDLRELGRAEQARLVNVDTLARCRAAFGDNHPTTLTCASNLALDLRALGQFEQARQINAYTLEKRRTLLGNDHLNTLRSASNLARNLYELGEIEKARELDEDTLERRRRVLGENHPDTLRSVNNLLEDTRALNEAAAGR